MVTVTAWSKLPGTKRFGQQNDVDLHAEENRKETWPRFRMHATQQNFGIII